MLQIANTLPDLDANRNEVLSYLIDQYGQDVILNDRHKASDDYTTKTEIINLYRTVIINYEAIIASNYSEDNIARFQSLHREFQCVVEENNVSQKSFIIVIPVADRPRHLEDCLDSLINLCQLFNYGGMKQGRYQGLTVLIADDSDDETNIKANKQICSRFSGLGLDVEYFGIDQQLQLLRCFPGEYLNSIDNIVGNIGNQRFSHKGASIMRNIVYLKLKTMKLKEDQHLVYFIDSDQEFRVCVNSDTHSTLYIKNYLYDLDSLFTQFDISVATGKVVGDPPVSPSVMISHMLDDVIGFLREAMDYNAEDACVFHGIESCHDNTAIYHDMADMFGFKNDISHIRYNCRIHYEHNVFECALKLFSKLRGFFHGAHPTRSTWYEYTGLEQGVDKARTVYTGNYIIKPSALDVFIPFATLKLRMAGPVMGRLLKSSIASQFVSVNLPMLHKRTLSHDEYSEFRAGVEETGNIVDLAEEFVNQYFGDVMLFTVEELNNKDIDLTEDNCQPIMGVLNQMDTMLSLKYMNRQKQIMDKCYLLNSMLTEVSEKWSDLSEYGLFKQFADDFISNVQHNFSADSTGCTLINDDEYRKKRLLQLGSAIISLDKDRFNWSSSFEKFKKCS